MPVMSARVHGALVGGLVREIGDLSDRERIDVRSQPNARPWVTGGCWEMRDDPGPGIGFFATDIGFEIDSHVGEVLLDDL